MHAEICGLAPGGPFHYYGPRPPVEDEDGGAGEARCGLDGVGGDGTGKWPAQVFGFY